MENTTDAPLRTRLPPLRIGLASAVVIVSTFSISVYIVLSLLINPYHSMFLSFPLLLVAGFILVYRTLKALTLLFLPKVSRLLSGLLVVTNLIGSLIVVGVLLSLLTQVTKTREIVLAKSYLQPVISQIDQYHKETGNFPTRLVNIQIPAKKIGFRYYHNKNNYMIEAYGRSIDLFGPAIYYLSTSGKWGIADESDSEVPDPPKNAVEETAARKRMVSETSYGL